MDKAKTEGTGVSRYGDILGMREKVFIDVLLRSGWSGADIKSLLFFNFGYRVMLSDIACVKWDKDLRKYIDSNPDILREAEEMKLKVNDAYTSAKMSELEKTIGMRMDVDERIIEKLEEGKTSVRDLKDLSKYLFEREQLLSGKPTSIVGRTKEMSDEELIKELKRLNAIEVGGTSSKRLTGKGASEGDREGDPAPGA